MIAADSSTWIAYWRAQPGADCDRLRTALADSTVGMPPPVLAELFSAVGLPAEFAAGVLAVPELAILPGFWQRAGELRARALALGRRARLGDALIAQCCLDHGVALLARDHDFRTFAAASDLALLTD